MNSRVVAAGRIARGRRRPMTQVNPGWIDESSGGDWCARGGSVRARGFFNRLLVS